MIKLKLYLKIKDFNRENIVSLKCKTAVLQAAVPLCKAFALILCYNNLTAMRWYALIKLKLYLKIKDFNRKNIVLLKCKTAVLQAAVPLYKAFALIV